MDKVQVLLSTYNGEKYIKEQIESILNQKDVEVSILVRDDGSFDNTIKILKELAKNNPITIYEGENLGPARSFMELLDNSGEFDYYSFSDQDDVWYDNKLIKAIEKLKNKEDIPSMYISAVEIVDENLNTKYIKKIEENCTFETEMIKNFAVGCTQVLNKKLRDEIKNYKPEFLIMHDSWITRVCLAIGGYVYCDNNPYMKYRQHGKNVLGDKDEGIQKLKRQFKIAFKDKVCMRVNISQELIKGYEEKLTKDAKEVIDNLIKYRTNFKSKIWLLKNKKFRTKNKKINIKMFIAILFNKF